jgi:hypothetical protein
MTPGGVVVDRAAGALPVHRGVRNLPVKVPHVPVEVSNLPAGVPHVLADLPNLSVEVPDLLVETPDLPVEVQDVHAELGHVPVEVPNLPGQPGNVPVDQRNLIVDVRHALKQDNAPCAPRLPYADAELRSARLRSGFAPLRLCFGSSEECGPRWPAALPGAPLQRRGGVDRPHSGHRHGCRCLFARAGDGMDAGVEATQEQLPDALSKSPAPARGLSGQDARKARKRGAPLLVTFSRASERK